MIDISVDESQVEVLSTNGDTNLVEDFDKRLIDHLVSEFKKDQNFDLTSDPLALQRLKVQVKSKIELSANRLKQIYLTLLQMLADQNI